MCVCVCATCLMRIMLLQLYHIIYTHYLQHLYMKKLYVCPTILFCLLSGEVKIMAYAVKML